MVRHMTLKMRKVQLILVATCVLVSLPLLASAESKTFQLLTGMNGISLPFTGTGVSTAEGLCGAIPYCTAASYWNASTQSFVKHTKGSATNNFNVFPGRPYFVTVSQNSSWTVSGSVPIGVTFSLTTGSGSNVNAVAIPVNYTLFRTAEDVLSAISNADAIWRWDPTKNGYIGHPKGSVINNFSVQPGLAYLVSVTASSSWNSDAPLNVGITATPSKGEIPFAVVFAGTVTSGSPPYTYAWDVNGDGITDDIRQTFSHTYNTYGAYTVTLKVTDAAGKTKTATTKVKAVVAPTVTASASPASGVAPCDIALSAAASDPDGSISLYEWDFNGDGSYDYNSSATGSVTHTYVSYGTFSAKVRVTDNDGMTGVGSVAVTVRSKPTASLVADKQTGNQPLAVNFTATGSDPDGTIVKYELDIDGDGTYDQTSTTPITTSKTYTNQGTYLAKLRVTDSDGLTDESSVFISVYGPPTALPGAYPSSGGAPLTVTFFANGSDLDGSPEYYDWDYDGDGTYDENLIASMNSTHTYTNPGTYNATLKVTDDDGLVGTATVVITVNSASSNPTAVADAIPSNGGAPLTVSLVGAGTDNGSIVKYEWDADGNGSYEFSETVGTSATVGTSLNVNYYSRPVFVDIDNDSDLDAFIGSSDGTITFFRNDGTSNSPVWTSMGVLKDSGGVDIDPGSYSAPAFVDIDGDGDLDLFVSLSGGIYFYRNTGSASAPIWTSVGIVKDSDGYNVSASYYGTIAFADIDGDGDQDLFIGNYYGTVTEYQNIGSSSSPSWDSVGELTDSASNSIGYGRYYGAPTLVDYDDDGDLDLLLGGYYGTVYYYRNIGTTTAPVWEAVGEITDSGSVTIDAGSSCAPCFVDIDGDGDHDLFVGNSNGYLVFYKNTGTSAAPVWSLVYSQYAMISVASYSAPGMGDLDGDGDQDLMVGSYDGTVIYAQNTGSTTAPAWSLEGAVLDKNGAVIDVVNYAIPRLADIDGDGDLDLFIGDSAGTVFYYRNEGTSSAPVWNPMGELQNDSAATIDVGYNSAPFLADIDGDGDLDLLIGEYYGSIRIYRNTGSATSPVWTSDGYLKDSSDANIDISYNAAPAFADLDNDGDLDLLIGEYYGKVYYYRNDGDAAEPSFTLVSTDYKSVNQSYTVSPFLADLDGDGDVDLLVGSSGGLVYRYDTYGSLMRTYSSQGTYNAVLRVTDNDGNTDTDSVTISVYAAGSPTAVAAAIPLSGSVPLTVAFKGKGLDSDGSIVNYEWDFDGDGVYDYSSTTTGKTSHTYDNVGTYTAKLRVTDNSGKQAIDTVPITTYLGISASSPGAFNPSAGETGSITTTLTAAAVVTITILDKDGNAVRTLVNAASRTAGTYTDVWNGLNNSSVKVKDGVYYFTIDYSSGDKSGTLDFRQGATFTEDTPSRTWSSDFNPFTESFVSIGYSTSKPAEVSLYLWVRDYSRPASSIAPVRTLFIREPQAAGSHTEIWDGVDDKGVVVGPAEGGYPVTLWVYSLPDSAILIVGNKPVITDIDADPNFICPAPNPYSTDSKSTTVSFNVSKAISTLEVKVTNWEGVVVRSMAYTGLSAGAHTGAWDGKDLSGSIVKEGAYSVSLTAVDSDGNRSLSRYAAVLVYY